MEFAAKLPIFILLLLIVGSLAGGMFQLTRQRGERDSTSVVRALTFRIVLSILLFAFLIGGYFFDLLKPHGL